MTSENSSVREWRNLDPAQVELLRGLKNANGGSLLSDVVNVMLSETPQRLRELKVLLSKGEPLSVAALAHKIAGSAAGLGAVVLRSRALLLEKTAKMLLLDELPDLFSQMEKAWDELRPELISLA